MMETQAQELVASIEAAVHTMLVAGMAVVGIVALVSIVLVIRTALGMGDRYYQGRR